MKVALVGGGSWGCALAHLLLKKGHLLRWWVHAEDIAHHLQAKRQHPSIFPEVVYPDLAWVGTDLQTALEGVEACVLALPARHIKSVLGEVPNLSGFWVSCTKGLVLGGGIQRPSQYLQAKGAEVAVLSGPSHAEEVIQDRPTWVAFAASKPELYEFGQALFDQPTFRLLPTPFLHALEWVGILKNLYAILLGVVSTWGENARAALAAVTLAEMQRVLQALVPEESPPFLSPGWAGDFLVTAFSMYSRNQRFGQLLGQGYSPQAALQKVGMVVEGYYAAQGLQTWPRKSEFPLLRAVLEVLAGQRPPASLREAITQALR
ncbi:MAG: hypothetical protein D6750_02050 [Bacteroidetes bacterium]|nr:MAG: hypothetical protein D6750_02050 [Bacteroidota bacterium]